MNSLVKLARRHSDVQEGIACKGTALERRTFTVNKKVFLFLGSNDLMLKLADSLPDTNKRASRSDDRIKVGKNGWVKIVWDDASELPLDVLPRWIEESYQLFAAASKKPATKKVKSKM